MILNFYSIIYSPKMQYPLVNYTIYLIELNYDKSNLKVINFVII